MTICDSLTGSSKLEIGNIACFTVLAPVLLYSIRWEYLSCQSGQSGQWSVWSPWSLWSLWSVWSPWSVWRVWSVWSPLSVWSGYLDHSCSYSHPVSLVTIFIICTLYNFQFYLARASLDGFSGSLILREALTEPAESLPADKEVTGVGILCRSLTPR